MSVQESLHGRASLVITATDPSRDIRCVITTTEADFDHRCIDGDVRKSDQSLPQ